ncbi:hypothetical protein EJ03DRAFT_186237 [Teratosphaeria nubilosa]|uniref:Secreted protein n=1 Tax=Teratosphaeria nubilosa TaxID=161662 RepID=A0A6G1LIV3_9PEZI|nr:hypothetical protein EJ03DRAFT_186237 [Teratosphaeria nubilosa]
MGMVLCCFPSLLLHIAVCLPFHHADVHPLLRKTPVRHKHMTGLLVRIVHRRASVVLKAPISSQAMAGQASDSSPWSRLEGIELQAETSQRFILATIYCVATNGPSCLYTPLHPPIS